MQSNYLSDPPSAPPSDPLDRATELEMMERDALVAAALARYAASTAERARHAAAGVCLNCTALLTDGQRDVQRGTPRYCDPGCQDDHRKRTQAHVRNGTLPGNFT